jgi:hypothetical protein
LTLACSAIAYGDQILHTPNGDIRYTTERIGTDLWVTYWMNGQELKKQHYTVDPDGSLRLLDEQ